MNDFNKQKCTHLCTTELNIAFSLKEKLTISFRFVRYGRHLVWFSRNFKCGKKSSAITHTHTFDCKTSHNIELHCMCVRTSTSHTAHSVTFIPHILRTELCAYESYTIFDYKRIIKKEFERENDLGRWERRSGKMLFENMKKCVIYGTLHEIEIEYKRN